MLKHAEIFQDFSKNFTQLKIFVVHVNVSYSSYLKWLKHYTKMLTLKLSAALEGQETTSYVKHQYIYRLRISNLLVKLVKMVEVFKPESPD